MFRNYQIKQISKIKCRVKLEHLSRDLPDKKFYIYKLTINGSDVYFASEPAVMGDFFIKMSMIKFGYQNLYFMPFKEVVEGNIYKKGEILGKWEQRFVRIDPAGLKSYKNPNMNYSLFIKNT